MTAAEYERIRKSFGFSQEAMGEWLGYTGRHGQRFSTGDAEIPKVVAMLLRTLVKHNLSIDEVGRGA